MVHVVGLLPLERELRTIAAVLPDADRGVRNLRARRSADGGSSVHWFAAMHLNVVNVVNVVDVVDVVDVVNVVDAFSLFGSELGTVANEVF